MHERAIPPPQCGARRPIRLRDRFWAWYWNVPMDDLIRCRHYKGHEEFGYPHECGEGKWP
jgi:hypothetical protein